MTACDVDLDRGSGGIGRSARPLALRSVNDLDR